MEWREYQVIMLYEEREGIPRKEGKAGEPVNGQKGSMRI